MEGPGHRQSRSRPSFIARRLSSEVQEPLLVSQLSSRWGQRQADSSTLCRPPPALLEQAVGLLQTTRAYDQLTSTYSRVGQDEALRWVADQSASPPVPNNVTAPEEPFASYCHSSA